jgi:release factor glutamine methyltransferase
LTEPAVFRPSTTRAEALALLSMAFGTSGLDEPSREARLALCAACGLSPATIISGPHAPLGAHSFRVEEFGRRRAGGEPLSKIVGRREFWGLPLVVSRDVLDPRPETETIVETAIGVVGDRPGAPLRVLDLGTGSGAILCALLTELPEATGVGADRSEAAAEIARTNLAACGLAGRAEVRVGSWTEGVEGLFDLIVSNPPYIPSGDLASLPREVRDFDPALALDGGPDGLDAYRTILPAAARLLAPGGWAIVEVGAAQAPDVIALATSAGLAGGAAERDLAGIDRVVIARRPTHEAGSLPSRPARSRSSRLTRIIHGGLAGIG